MSFNDENMNSLYSELTNLYNLVNDQRNISDLEKMYVLLKENSLMFFNNDILDPQYQSFTLLIKRAETIFRNRYLLDIGFYLKKNLSIFEANSDIDILNYIVNCARRNYIYGFCFNTNDGLLYRKKWSFDLANKCELISNFVKKICCELNIQCYVLKISPGYSKNDELFDGTGYHFANIIKLNNQYFLVDITYSQFFNIGRTSILRNGLPFYPTTSLGYFMMLSEKQKLFASDIISDGYILLNDEKFKMYMDGFTLSFRNGLFYKNTGDYSYQTDYSVNDYINFLTGSDNQVNHEGREVLGFQKHL